MDGFWLWVYSLSGVGSKKIRKLRSEIYSKPRIRGWQVFLARKLTGNVSFSDENIRAGIRKLKVKLKELKIGVLSYWHPQYPRLLRELPDYPAFLFYKGRSSRAKIFDRCVSMVGTRGMTQYGKSVVCQLIEPLAASEMTVVSGLAFGVDAEVHRCLIETGEGVPVAVVPGGPDRGFPEANRGLYSRILDCGLVISEHLPGTELVAGMFASRNRIVAGLSRAVVVVEAPEKSGALITADLALQYGRDVYAVPGSVFSRMSVGTNELINQGACLVKDGYDILRNLGFPDVSEGKEGCVSHGVMMLSKEFGVSIADADSLVVKFMESGMAVEDISICIGRSVQDVRRILTQLEIKGIFMRGSDGKYKLCVNYFETGSSRVACKG